tara:strand:- start:481 stop:735 length:255 start_codon:yes stop_codon:yes gene_type:complete
MSRLKDEGRLEIAPGIWYKKVEYVRNQYDNSIEGVNTYKIYGDWMTDPIVKEYYGKNQLVHGVNRFDELHRMVEEGDITIDEPE